jgi:hypothetical protein
MVDFAKVQDSPGFVRDMSNKALLNSDSSAILSYKKQRERRNDINEAMADINMLKNEMSDIKGLLMQLLQNKGIV